MAATSVPSLDATRMVGDVPVWHQRMEVVPGVHTPEGKDPIPLLRRLGLPARMDGQRVLDVGCLDGFFSFEMERRGAEVVSAHLGEPTPGYQVMHQLRDSQARSETADVYELHRRGLGTFDMVLFLGGLHHLRHPLLALDGLAAMVRVDGSLILECHAIDQGLIGPDGNLYALSDPALRLMQFYPGTELSQDATNWWAPSLSCLESMIASTPFRVRTSQLWSPGRALVRAVREPTGRGDEVRFAPGPDLMRYRALGAGTGVRGRIRVQGGSPDPDPAIHL